MSLLATCPLPAHSIGVGDKSLEARDGQHQPEDRQATFPMLERPLLTPSCALRWVFSFCSASSALSSLEGDPSGKYKLGIGKNDLLVFSIKHASASQLSVTVAKYYSKMIPLKGGRGVGGKDTCCTSIQA